MTTATYFSVTGTYSGFNPNAVMSADVLFTPVFGSGDIATATTLTPPTGFIPAPVPARINGGQLQSVDGSTVQLVANVNLGLSGSLYYEVTFANAVLRYQHPTVSNITVDSEQIVLDSVTFAAPTSATSVDLVSVTPAPAPAIAAGAFVVPSGGAPATSSSPGRVGQISWDSGYVYVAVAAGTWKRAALSTF